MDELKPFILPCAICGERAIHAIEIPFLIERPDHEDHGHATAIPFCAACTVPGMAMRLGEMRPVSLPTHQPAQIDIVAIYPPQRGQLHFQSMVLGCPGCGTTVGLQTPPFELIGGELRPSFICPRCEIHINLRARVPIKEP